MPAPVYSRPLSLAGQVRLLQILPNEQLHAQIQAKLVEHTLEELKDINHDYETLAYSHENDGADTILLCGQPWSVPRTLHAALRHLRRAHQPRDIWVDAICIDPSNDQERALSAISLSRVCGQAIRANLWLGERANDSDVVFKAIKTATQGNEGVENSEGNHSTPEPVHQTVDEIRTLRSNTALRTAARQLLERPCFRDIMAMAEIAPAHDVRILCGAHEIAGAAFCSGLYSLLCQVTRPLSYSVTRGDDSVSSIHFHPVSGLCLVTTFSNTQNKLSYRPSDIDTHLPHDSSTNPAESSLLNFTKFVSMNSQNIITSWLEKAPNTYTVGELLDMFHTYTALQRHDRIYALVSMSSDGHLSTEGILPDYKVPWKVLFARLIRSIIGASALLTTWNHIDTAVIEARGVKIGTVNRVARPRHLGIIEVCISRNSLPSTSGGWEMTWWKLQPTAKAIKKGDMVCVLDGFANPTIVRKLNDYFVVVALSATPLPTAFLTDSASEKASYMREFDFSYSFLLVWDWTSDPSNMPMQYEDLPDEINQFPSKGSRLCNISLISAMGSWNQNTKSCLERAIHWYEDTTSEESMEEQTILALLQSLVAACDHDWTEDERWLWTVRGLRTAPQTRKEYSTIQDLTHTVSSLRALGIIKLTPEATEVKRLLHMTTESAKFTEEEVLTIIELGRLGALIPLLERIDNFPVTREIMPSLVTRATGWGGQEEVLKAVIDHKGPDFITAEAVMAVVSERYRNDLRPEVALPVMRLFLERKGSSIITQQVVEAAARQSDAEFGFAITQLFYEHVGDRIITQGAVDAAACNRDIRRGAILLRYLLNRINNVHITDNIVKAFAEKEEALENLDFLLKRFDFPITENMVAAIIVNPKQAPSLLRLLLDSGRDAIPITSDTILKANRNQYQRQKILQIIKDNRPDDQQIQIMILEALKENNQEDKVLNLLSDCETDSEEEEKSW